MLIGQTKLNNLINTFDINSMPRVILLNGDRGCGKHTFASQISEKLNLNLYPLNDVNSTELAQITVAATPSIYLIENTYLI